MFHWNMINPNAAISACETAHDRPVSIAASDAAAHGNDYGMGCLGHDDQRSCDVGMAFAPSDIITYNAAISAWESARNQAVHSIAIGACEVCGTALSDMINFNDAISACESAHDRTIFIAATTAAAGCTLTLSSDYCHACVRVCKTWLLAAAVPSLCTNIITHVMGACAA